MEKKLDDESVKEDNEVPLRRKGSLQSEIQISSNRHPEMIEANLDHKLEPDQKKKQSDEYKEKGVKPHFESPPKHDDIYEEFVSSSSNDVKEFS